MVAEKYERNQCIICKRDRMPSLLYVGLQCAKVSIAVDAFLLNY